MLDQRGSGRGLEAALQRARRKLRHAFDGGDGIRLAKVFRQPCLAGAHSRVGVGIAAAMWWLYFDVSVWLAEDMLARATPGREQNELARDAYSLLHFPMVAGIVLVALGLKSTLAHVDDPLETVPAVALLGGVAVYLLAHIGFGLRTSHTLSGSRLVGAVGILLLYPFAVEVRSLVAVALVLAVLCAVIAYELVRHADTRREVRAQIHEAHA